ncbi:MAG: PAS domain S-box protein, partial [bacterium]|nr:PAS domain S-box protein [bacterium]
FTRVRPLSGLDDVTAIQVGGERGLVSPQDYSWWLVSRVTRPQLRTYYLASTGPYQLIFGGLTALLALASALLSYGIGARRKARAEMRLQMAALAAAANGIVITDREGTILWVNSAFAKLTGYSASEAIGQSPRLLRSGRHGREVFKVLWSTVLAGRVWRGELINRRKDGSLYNEEQIVTPLVDRDGRVSHFIAIKQDITGLKSAEDALRHRVQVEDLVARISTRFIQLKAANVDRGIEEALAEVGAFLEGERAFIRQFRDDLTPSDWTSLWQGEASDLKKGDWLQDQSSVSMPWFTARIARNEPVVICDLDELPADARIERSILEIQGVCSIVIVPMEFQDRIRGFLGVCCRHRRDWASDDVAMLLMVGQIMTNALQR